MTQYKALDAAHNEFLYKKQKLEMLNSGPLKYVITGQISMESYPPHYSTSAMLTFTSTNTTLEHSISSWDEKKLERKLYARMYDMMFPQKNLKTLDKPLEKSQLYVIPRTLEILEAFSDQKKPTKEAETTPEIAVTTPEIVVTPNLRSILTHIACDSHVSTLDQSKEVSNQDKEVSKEISNQDKEVSNQDKEVSKDIYEGAGVLLYYVDKKNRRCNLILGERQKKPEDVAKDPTKELEYFGGKPEKGETPAQTAFNELIEEVGANVLDVSWESRAKVLHTFQPISKKWIWCYLLQVNDAEMACLKIQDVALTEWGEKEKRDFSALTNRAELARKALKGLYLASYESVLEYLSGFSKIIATGNRMKDAKEYGKTAIKFVAHRLNIPEDSTEGSTEVQTTLEYPLRGFNLVIFEQHVSTITQHIENSFTS